MANYELSNIAWKGNTYIVKDNSALHQSAIGSWTPDFANLKPLATYEYDIASTSYFKICERPNAASIKDIADEVLAFRITVTGSYIFSVADVLVRFQPTVGQRPLVVVNHQTQSVAGATTGIRYLRTVNPKAANTSYKYEIAVAAYNTTSRHIKVEVFKAPSEWAFSSAATTYSYNSTYQTASDLTLYTNIGILYNYTFYGTASYANYAGYKSSWDGLFNGQGNFINAGAAIAANQFVFIGKDNKVYPTTSTSVEIDPAWPIVYCTTAVSSGSAVAWSYLRSWGYFTPASSILKDGTLVADDTVYMRCAYVDGKLYSSNTMTQTLTAGNTYIKLGKMYSATAVSVNTYNSEYFTLDTDGHIKALNGYLFNAAKADTASTVSKAGSTATGSYGILFDNNLITDILNTTTSPRVNAGLTFNPSTGNLSSTLFTGSGAGLTDIPLSGIQGGDELLPTKLLHVYHDLDNDSYSFTDSLTDSEIANILDSAFRGEINLNVELSDVDTIQLLKYYYPFNYVFLEVLMFETSPVAGIDQTAWTNNALPSYFAIAFALTDPPTFQFISISGTNLNAVAQQFTQLLGEKEDLSNKVASVDSSSTDDQYPSAKLLYDTKNTLSGLIQDVDEAIPTKVEMSKRVFTGTCTTAAGTAAKTVNVGDGFELEDGVKVRVYMNTANSNTTPTLNVNSTGAKSIVIAGPAATSNEALSNATSGFFKRNGWFEFTYAASYGSGAGRWVMDDTYSAGRLLNTFMARPSSINSDIANGGVRYGVIASSATGNPFSATASVLWLHHDSANYTRQIAIAATIPPQMAFRAQNNGTWQPWEYVLSSANELENHMATMAYTAAEIDFTTGAVTIPIDGTEYKLLQLTVFNNDISKPLGYPSLFLFNASGTIGYKEGTSMYCSATSTSSSISVTFDSSWNIIGSTSVDITALYRRIS